jgi:hypothetical protein
MLITYVNYITQVTENVNLCVVAKKRLRIFVRIITIRINALEAEIIVEYDLF